MSNESHAEWDDRKNDSMELVEDRGYAPRVSSLVSLPLRRTSKKKIVKRNGDLVVELQALGKALPYGKMPRALDAIVATLILTRDPSWRPETRRLYVGHSFYAFAEHKLGITRGGDQYRRLREQLGYWMRLAYTIMDYGHDDIDVGGQFVTCEAWHVRWLDMEEWEEHPERGEECFLQFSEMYVRKIIRENPVPVSFRVLRELNRLKSPLAMDIYLWLNRRMSYLHQPSLVTWTQLRDQFGSDAQMMKKFKQTFKNALAHVETAWPEVRVTVSDERGVTLFPSETPVPTVAMTRKREKDAMRAERRGDAADSGHWTSVAGAGRVWTTTDLFDVTAARAHFDGTTPAAECRYCLFDERNRASHGPVDGGVGEAEDVPLFEF